MEVDRSISLIFFFSQKKHEERRRSFNYIFSTSVWVLMRFSVFLRFPRFDNSKKDDTSCKGLLCFDYFFKYYFIDKGRNVRLFIFLFEND